MTDAMGWLLSILLGLLGLCMQSNAADYDVVADSSGFLNSCEDVDHVGNINISDVIDWSNLTFRYEDDVVYATGDVVVKLDVPKDIPIRFELEVYKWIRGEWVATPATIKRNDLCKSIFDPFELWASLVKDVPKEQRVCPPKPGTIYGMYETPNSLDVRYFPLLDLDGRYKAVTHFYSGPYVACADLRVNIYRI